MRIKEWHFVSRSVVRSESLFQERDTVRFLEFFQHTPIPVWEKRAGSPSMSPDDKIDTQGRQLIGSTDKNVSQFREMKHSTMLSDTQERHLIRSSGVPECQFREMKHSTMLSDTQERHLIRSSGVPECQESHLIRSSGVPECQESRLIRSSGVPECQFREMKHSTMLSEAPFRDLYGEMGLFAPLWDNAAQRPRVG